MKTTPIPGYRIGFGLSEVDGVNSSVVRNEHEFRFNRVDDLGNATSEEPPKGSDSVELSWNRLGCRWGQLDGDLRVRAWSNVLDGGPGKDQDLVVRLLGEDKCEGGEGWGRRELVTGYRQGRRKERREGMNGALLGGHREQRESEGRKESEIELKLRKLSFKCG
ncbi:hypothetical protein C8F01DRAFT_1106585 [Mycena amicta]|nr:hypothetical protein C8F01DRAFT_1106585 [Mycena amicta]